MQASYIEMLAANGPLRDGLTADDAASTYSALANPATFSLLTEQHRWSPEKFETWLAESLSRLLL